MENGSAIPFSANVPKESGAKWRLPAEEGQYTRTSHVGSGLVLAKTRCKAALVERGKAAEWTVELKQMDMVLSSKMPMPHMCIMMVIGFMLMRRIRMCAEVEQGSGRLVALEDGDLG
ncbi:hypothetical protein Tco_0935843 [Tanacetum coccineum]